VLNIIASSFIYLLQVVNTQLATNASKHKTDYRISAVQ